MHGKRWVVALLLIAPVVVGCGSPQAGPVSREASDVVVDRPLVRDVTDYEEFTGHTDAILSVQVKSRVTGYLEKKHFQDGQEVHAGDLLYEIDDRPYKAEMDRANASVAFAEAHRNRLAHDHRRALNLFQRGVIGKQEFDLISGDFAEAEAAVSVVKAQQEAARLDLSFTKVRAPMDGQLSRTLVDPGNLIRQDDTLLTDIVAADKLYVYFDLNESTMGRVRDLIAQGRVGGVGGREVPVLVGVSDQETFPYKGLVNFTENKLDAATGTLRLRGIIDNPGPRVLSPGLFVRVRLPIGAPHPTVLVANRAVGSDQGRMFVYVVDRNEEVEYRPVEVGPIYEGDMRAITKGLASDERIIVENLERIRPGTKVSPRMVHPSPSEKTASRAGGDRRTGRLTRTEVVARTRIPTIPGSQLPRAGVPAREMKESDPIRARVVGTALASEKLGGG